MTALRRHHARTRLQQRIEAGLIVIGSAISERVDRHIDDARVARRQALIVEAELAHPAGAQILDHDVGLVDEPVDDFAARGRSRDLRKAALALVPAEKAEAEMTKRIALEALDLDNFGAELREYHRAVRSRDVAGEVEHRDAVERRPFGGARVVFVGNIARWL